MTEGITMVFRFVTRHGDNLANLLCIKLGYGSGARGFLKAIQHRKIIATFDPVLTPASDGFSIALQVLRCFLKTFTFCTSKDNFGSQYHGLGAFTPTHNQLKVLALLV